MKLARPRTSRAMISVVSMIDVLMILLIFFMVTSSYLDLTMVPMAKKSDAAPVAGERADPASVLIRLGADGSVRVAGRDLDAEGLAALLSARLAANPATSIVVLPSGQAPAQALVAVMDTATRAGATRLQVLRVDAAP